MNASSRPPPSAPAADAPDESLLDRLGQGDVDALGALYDRYGRTLLALATSILRSRADAEDVVHDAFVSMVDCADRYVADRGSVGAWLATLVRNRSIDRLRSGQRRGRLERDVLSHEPTTPAHASPEKLAIDASEGASVRRALASLPQAQRETLEGAFLEGLTFLELASRLGVPVGTVKSRAHRGMASLRRAIE